jgi:hypothetical protein
MKPNMHYVCVMDYDEADTCLVAACRSEENASNIYDMLSTEYDMLWWDVLSDRPSLHLKDHDPAFYADIYCLLTKPSAVAKKPKLIVIDGGLTA